MNSSNRNAPKAVNETHRPEICRAAAARLPRIMLRIPAPIPSPSRISCFRTTVLTAGYRIPRIGSRPSASGGVVG